MLHLVACGCTLYALSAQSQTEHFIVHLSIAKWLLVRRELVRRECIEMAAVPRWSWCLLLSPVLSGSAALDEPELGPALRSTLMFGRGAPS